MNSEAEKPDPQASPLRAIDRRDFLKLTGFSLGGVLLAGCQQAKMEKAIPFLVKPEEVTPGLSTWYATMCGGCSAGCGVMGKTRDGRPIKLEGMPDHPVSQGGLCAVGQAHLLGLYDSQRMLEPHVNGRTSAWEEIDASIMKQLDVIRSTGGAVRVLTGTITSPATKEMIRRFLARFKDSRHIQYDAISVSAILDAHEKTHGVRILPGYRFGNAEVIVSFDADFLGTWISPMEFTAGYRNGRVLDGKSSKFSHHVQFESRLSLTGAKADERVRMSPSEIRAALYELARLIRGKSSASDELLPLRDSHHVSLHDSIVRGLTLLADKLLQSRGRSIVVCGINDLSSQIVVNYVNELLGNYGTTLDPEHSSNQHQGNDGELLKLIEEMKSGTVSALITYGCNPVYDLPDGEQFAGLMSNVPLVISYADRMNETASAARIVCPEPHPLESWNDAEPVSGVAAIGQPLIKPFGKTRSFIESLSVWMGENTPAIDIIKQEWQRTIFPRQSAEKNFQTFWDAAVQNGFASIEPNRLTLTSFNRDALVLTRQGQDTPHGTGSLAFDLVLYPSFTLLDGRHAHNPWLQELPDPVSKIVWDNYVSVSPATAITLGIREGDVVKVDADGKSVGLPAHIQPGQHDGVVAIALGYGRKGTDRFTNIGPQWLEAKKTVAPGEFVGKNVASFLSFVNGNLSCTSRRITLTKTGENRTLACTQDHHELTVPERLASKHDEPRPIVRQASLVAYIDNPAAGGFHEGEIVSMWSDDHAYTGHHWGMAIDLSACTGCAACVVSCMAENNIPVVGKDEVHRNRELSWIRIDRYYEQTADGDITGVSQQPMMCQHCGNAPCETVCPVLATVHSSEGLNQQIYNRCVGTRYCSNNCPYKVRRFNWFDYELGDEMQRLVLNPDVTTRERGIMEKCSFCVQRIQEAKIEAKKNGLKVKDGDIRPACAQSCPAQAIVFGDMNDPESMITRKMKDPRFYRVLEELGIKPSVGYMTLVRNTEERGDVHHG